MAVGVTRLVGYWQRILASYWFVPTMMTAVAITLSFVVIRIDAAIGGDWIKDTPWLYSNQPDGARQLLATIAGSMITVAGVTFSITIAALAQTTSQFGPRLLTNFMYDRGNQVTLGTFIATFVFCLLVMRTIQGDGNGVSRFVPHLGILGGVLFGLASLGVLIYFIHHIAGSIQVPNMVARIGEDLIAQMDRLFPTGVGHPVSTAEADEALARGLETAVAIEIGPNELGYLQYIDGDGLMNIACRADIVVHVDRQLGDFAVQGKPLLRAWPRDHVTANVAGALRDAFMWGTQRTKVQDSMFLVNELVEVAIRALSPGINDAYTATSCIDWLGLALQMALAREPPSPFRADSSGKIRLIVRPVSIEDMMEGIFEELRASAERDRMASLTLMKLFVNTIERSRKPEHVEALRGYAAALMEGCERALPHPRDKAAVHAAYSGVASTRPREWSSHCEPTLV